MNKIRANRLTSKQLVDTRRRSLLKSGGILVATALATGCGGSDTSGATLQSPPPPPGSPLPASPPPPAPGFFAIPSLQDERATYDLLGRTRTAGDEAFTFNTSTVLPTRIDIHGDTEGDDLWVWRQHKARGYTGAVVDHWNAQWLNYFKTIGRYEADHGAINAPGTDFGVGEWDHTYVGGLCLCYVLDGDTTALSTAELIGDRMIWKVCTNRALLTGFPEPTTANFYGRHHSRWTLTFIYLAAATGSAKWIRWRDSMLECWMQGTTWIEAPSVNMVQGGFYFVPRSSLPFGSSSVANYDAGQRVNNSFYFALSAEVMICGYKATGRADIRARIIKMARYVQYYGHIPTHTVPLLGSYFGVDHFTEPFASAGGRWKSPFADNSASCAYDAGVVNILVWGYKFTGDIALLNMARLCLAQCNRWASEGGPGGTHTAPQVGLNEVNYFIDTHNKGGQGSEQFQMNGNKGQLQYCYQIFENGGMPARVA